MNQKIKLVFKLNISTALNKFESHYFNLILIKFLHPVFGTVNAFFTIFVFNLYFLVITNPGYNEHIWPVPYSSL